MTRPTLDFYFEFASTYSYLSAMRLPALAEAAGVVVRWKPFLLGPIFKTQGWTTSPFNIYAAKGRYMWRDMERLTDARGLSFTRPDPFPQNSLLAARVALLALKQRQGVAFCQNVYLTQFGMGQNIAERDTIAACLSACDLPVDLIDQAETDTNKHALRLATEEAQRLGLFGAPSFLAAGELFWGDDRLPAALAHAKAA